MDDSTKNLIQSHIDTNEVCLFMKGTPDAPQCGFSMATAFSLFGNDEVHDGDMLNQAEHTLKAPVEVILMLFGFANAGVVFSSIGEATWLVLGGLIIGKPLGIFLFGFIAVVILRLGLPQSMRLIDLVIIGFVAAIGFTVSLFISAVAFGPGEVQDAAKMGALFSFGAVFLSLIVAKIIGVKKIT